MVYKITKDVWEEEISIKASDMTDEEKSNKVRQRRPKYHEGQGKKLKRYADGWTEDERLCYKELHVKFKDLRCHQVWTKLQEQCKT